MEQLENIILGPRYAVRLEQLRPWHVLRVTCGVYQCGHVGVVMPSELARRYPGYTPLLDIGKKLRCSRCGNREDNRWETCKLPRNL